MILSDKMWILGKTTDILPYRSYKVIAQHGTEIRRNKRVLRKTDEEFKEVEHEYK